MIQTFITGSSTKGLGNFLSKQLECKLLSRDNGYNLEHPESFLIGTNDHIFINCAIDYSNPWSQVELAKQWLKKYKNTNSTLINIGSVAIDFESIVPTQFAEYTVAKQVLDKLTTENLQEQNLCNCIILNLGRLRTDKNKGIAYEEVYKYFKLMLDSLESQNNILYRMNILYDRKRCRT